MKNAGPVIIFAAMVFVHVALRIADMGEMFEDNRVVGLVNAWWNMISLEATMSSNVGLEISSGTVWSQLRGCRRCGCVKRYIWLVLRRAVDVRAPFQYLSDGIAASGSKSSLR